ncbi:MAG TPA: alpha/beta hydrolase [Longimicrobiales bacterium]
MTIRQGRLETDGLRASWREAGAGRPAIVTAGLGLTGRFYEESYEAFAAAGIQLIIPDLPGWGETPGPRTGLTSAQSAEFLIAFAHELGIRGAVWIGHSLGAQAVVRLAGRRPDLAAGIVLVGPTGAPGRMELLRQVRGLAVEAKRTSWAVIRAVARDYIRTSPVRYVGTWLRHSGDSIVERLPAVRCPALILAGDADPVCRPEFVELLRHCIPHAEVAWVPGGTHALPRGRAEAFNRAVIAFIRSIG